MTGLGDDRHDGGYDTHHGLSGGVTGPNPIDTIREALSFIQYRMEDGTDHEWYSRILAALTQVEQHTRSLEGELATELQLAQGYYERAVAAEQRANDLADALRKIANNERWVQAGPWIDFARAALDRQAKS